MLIQHDIAEHLDMSQQAVSQWLARLAIDLADSTLDDIRVAYIRSLREQAAGRAASGDLDLAAERAKLARAQRERIEMEVATERGRLIPADLIEPKIRAAIIAAREAWRDSPERLARGLVGKTIDESVALLSAEFDAFLVRFSRWPMTTTDAALAAEEFDERTD